MKIPDDPRLAHALARIGLGTNIALHGLTRIPKFGEFSAHLHAQFANSILPAPLVQVSAYGITATEATVGTLLLLGLFQRPVLVAGSLLMITLLFGTCLIQNFSVAGDQLIYLAFFTLLLATRKYGALCLDHYLHRPSTGLKDS